MWIFLDFFSFHWKYVRSNWCLNILLSYFFLTRCLGQLTGTSTNSGNNNLCYPPSTSREPHLKQEQMHRVLWTGSKGVNVPPSTYKLKGLKHIFVGSRWNQIKRRDVLVSSEGYRRLGYGVWEIFWCRGYIPHGTRSAHPSCSIHSWTARIEAISLSSHPTLSL